MQMTAVRRIWVSRGEQLPAGKGRSRGEKLPGFLHIIYSSPLKE
jgi:hypothetical protein